MFAARRVFLAFLLLCVTLALGDAPYVDEFLADFAAATANAHPTMAGHHDAGSRVPAKHGDGSSRICQNLLNLSSAPGAIDFLRHKTAIRVADTARSDFSSASASRIERPPASTAA